MRIRESSVDNRSTLLLLLFSSVFLLLVFARVQHASAISTLSINDVTLMEDSCQNKSFVFTLTLSKLTGKSVSVHYATSDASPDHTGSAAVANQDYVPVSGTLTFAHGERPNGPQGSYLATIAVELGDHVSAANDARSFTVTLSGATNAVISKAQGSGILLRPASSCLPPENAGCFVNFCGAARSCSQVNRSAGETPYAVLEGLGVSPSADPNFAACQSAGIWRDSDGDGFSDAAETQGYLDVNSNGINDPDIDVPLPDADPSQPDVYLHYDYVAARDHDHNPPAPALQLVVEAFAAHGVRLHIDPQHNAIDESSAKVITLQANAPNYLPDPACSGPSAKSTYQLRQETNFGLKQLAYHYAVFAHYSTCGSAADCLRCTADLECGGGQPPPFGATGSGEINGDDFMVSLGAYTDAGVPISYETWAGVLMHELGHNLGLKHGGADCDNYKPNYLSVMNYSFFNTGIPVSKVPGDSFAQACLTDLDCGPAPDCPGPDCEAAPHCSTTTHRCYRLDFSSFRYNDLNETGLDETIGLAGTPSSRNLTIWTPDQFSNLYYGPTNGSHLDWNRDGDAAGFGIQQDINEDGEKTLLTGSNDWAMKNGVFINLNFAFQTVTNFANDGGTPWLHGDYCLPLFSAGNLRSIASAESPPWFRVP